MARFSVGGDDDGNEEGTNNNRSLPKRPPQTASAIIYTVKRIKSSAASTSNSGARAVPSNPASTSAAPQPPLQQELRPKEPQTVHEESEEESEEESDSSFCDSSEEELGYEDEGEEENQQSPRSGDEVQPTEPRVNSTPNGNGTGSEPERPVADAQPQASFSVILTDPDVLDCPICLEPLSPPVYQCENGHVACAPCCSKMGNKCASCCWPIGYNRCRAIEKVLESVRVPCQNKQHGCMESLNYGKKLDHEKTCCYAPCTCPLHGCSYASLPNCLYTHFATKHSGDSKLFRFNDAFLVTLESTQKHVFLQERHEKILFILNRSIGPFGSSINVVCIAPTSSKRQFMYDLTAKDGLSSIRLKSVAESTPQWIAQPPKKKYVLVPKDFPTLRGQLSLELTIWRDRASSITITRCCNNSRLQSN